MSRIFVVEDEGVVAEDIAQTLEQLGYEVAGIAQSGNTALQALEARRPDLILMDIKLAGNWDGIQTTAEIRKRWPIPVIYLTAHSDEGTLRRAKETGPHGYLLKPFNDRDLRTAIEVALRKHELEQRLELRERWFSTTLESVGDAVIATDPNGRITFMNAVAERITGYEKEDARGKPLVEVFNVLPSGDADTKTLVTRAIQGGFRAELPRGTRLLDRVGTTRDVDDSIAPIVDPVGHSLGSVLVFRDITEKRRLEARLALAERLASLSVMAAGMAHELNNPLAAVSGNIEFALRRLRGVLATLREAPGARALAEGLEEASEALDDAQVAGTRMRHIVSDLKKFARSEQPTHTPLDLPDVVEAALKLTQHLARGAARVKTRFGTTPLVSANEGQLVQVLTNLVANALEAGAEHEPQEVEVVTRTDELGRAVVEVKDGGPGIRAEDLPRLFEPFFSTKASGLGLGLSICQNIVTAAGGEISVVNGPERGATFRVVLPAAEAREDVAPRSSSTPAAPRRARVLVIDDEDIVVRMIERLLRNVHEVQVATDPLDGLSRLARGEVYDVVLCDLTMPSVTGIDVYTALLKTNPDLARRMIFLTGGVVSPRVEKFLEGCSNLVLQKPFNRAALLTAIADHLP